MTNTDHGILLVVLLAEPSTLSDHFKVSYNSVQCHTSRNSLIGKVVRRSYH